MIESVAWSALAAAQAMAPVFIAVWLRELTVVGCTFVCFLCAGIAVLYEVVAVGRFGRNSLTGSLCPARTAALSLCDPSGS